MSKSPSRACKVVNLPIYKHIPILCTEYICTKSQIFHSSWFIFGDGGEKGCKKKKKKQNDYCNSLIPGDLYLEVGLFIFPPNEEPPQTYLSARLLHCPHMEQDILQGCFCITMIFLQAQDSLAAGKPLLFTLVILNSLYTTYAGRRIQPSLFQVKHTMKLKNLPYMPYCSTNTFISSLQDLTFLWGKATILPNLLIYILMYLV